MSMMMMMMMPCTYLISFLFCLLLVNRFDDCSVW